MDGYILGLDPGTRVGYALLDLYGNIVDIDSFKGDLNEAIFRTSKYNILVVGTDVCKIPRFVGRFASRIGAQVVFPENNLLFYEKRKKTKEYLKKLDIKLKNKHEMDALAAALIAYRGFKSLFNISPMCTINVD